MTDPLPKRSSGPTLLRFAVAGLLLGGAAPLPGLEPDLVNFQGTVQPFVNKYCVECHGPDKQKAGVRMDTLGPISVDNPFGETWREVQRQVLNEDMPPVDHELQPTDAEKVAFTEWIANEIHRAEEAHQDQGGQVVMRRLNAAEYRETLRELLYLHPVFDPAPDIPEDQSYDGFDNIGSALDMSMSQLAVYMENAGVVLQKAFPAGNPPNTRSTRVEPEELRELEEELSRLKQVRKDNERDQSLDPAVRSKREGEIRKQLRNALTAFREASKGFEIRSAQGWTPEGFITAQGGAVSLNGAGIYRFRIRAKGVPNEVGDLPLLQMGLFSKSGSLTFDSFAMTPEYQVYESEVYFEPKLYNKGTFSVANMGSRYFYRGGTKPAQVAVDWVEWEGPLAEDWPSKAYHVYFGDTEETEAGAREILGKFAERAFRRPPEPQRLEDFVAFYRQKREGGADFRESVLGAMRGILSAPEFLYMVEYKSSPDGQKEPLDNYELATRLSYFLWSGPPDEELYLLARQGKLTDPAVLLAQTDRMLEDERAENFAANFTGQWLKTRTLGQMAPDPKKYVEWEETLQEAMRRETETFFLYLVRENLPITNLIDSEFTMLNARLAYFYGVDGVDTADFQPVKLGPDTPRGGLLSQAAIHTLTSDGLRTSPVKRGAFILENILGTPPPPPPNDVPPVGEVEGATLKERLKSHRDDPACANCHLKIDPLGFALENFNAIGKWRTEEEDSGLPVDASGQMIGSGPFEGFEDFQQQLLARKDDVTRCLAEKMMTYALGRPVGFNDHQTIEQLTLQTKANDYRIRSLVHGIITSDAFLNK